MQDNLEVKLNKEVINMINFNSMKKIIFTFITIFFFTNKLFFSQCEIISFSGQQIASNIEISWQTQNELNLSYFTIEKSLDGVNYEFVQNVNAIGNSLIPVEYGISDNLNLQDTCYSYRIQATSLDLNHYNLDTTNVCFSSLLAEVIFESKPDFYSIYPNPSFDNDLKIEFFINSNYYVEIYNSLGQLIYQRNGKLNNLTVAKEIFEKGIYYLKIRETDGQFITTKIIDLH